MRNKISITNKLESIDSELQKLNYFINSGDRDSALVALGEIKDIYGDIITLLNIETQD
jgi:hypothetical protein|tara:strand:+ start:51 stop:224 length:174 start_codon:yes stop_codon:yes gene_type:complete